MSHHHWHGGELSRLRTDDLPHHLPGNTEITADRLDRLTVNKIRATDLSNRLHDQHSNLGSHENGSQCGPSVPGSRLDADHPENGVLIPCRNTLVAYLVDGHWVVDALGAPYVGERTEKQLIAAFCDKITELAPQLVTFNGNSFDLPVLR